ncbi:MAG: cell division protein FtsQ [Candidatus Omnitrophica bacterium]|nr:cell division protein FtsQ [Candidatus Omnitrophota bacterium]
MIKDSRYFAVKEVIIRGAEIELSYLKGRNIFDIDLRKESKRIVTAYPVYKMVKLIRLFPDRLFADFAKRTPYACVKLYRTFVVDDEGVFFDYVAPQEIQGLPIITGLETKIFGPRPGIVSGNKELHLAITIIKAFKNNKILKRFRITRIDMFNLQSVSIFIDKLYSPGFAANGVEIKIWPNTNAEKLRVLGGLLKFYGDKLDDIKYIDLRFKDPVIKFKDAKSS